jgi:lipoprotein-releasing system permease protein
VTFEFFIAGRYLRARRKEKVISVITVISIVGVAAGVMALIISLAVNNGFRNTLQRNLLAATAHVNVLAKDSGGPGIANYDALGARLKNLPHVVAVSPVLYDEALVSGPVRGKYATVKGIRPADELATSETLRHLKSGSIDGLKDVAGKLPGLIVGSKLAEDTGLTLNSVVTVISPEGEVTPEGPRINPQRFRVAGTFETGFYQVDDTWAYASLPAMQRLLSANNVVNSIELRVDNIDRAREIAREVERVAGPHYNAEPWQEANHDIIHALQMERAVTWITIGMIELVGALNIFITLTMIVLTKYRDIAVLMSMGAKRRQIRRIFVAQGAIIGVVGTAIGLVIGYSLCYFADRYHLVPLNESVYSLSFVPFEPRGGDGVWIAAAALTVSLLATLYPARNATQITPVEVLRYE